MDLRPKFIDLCPSYVLGRRREVCNVGYLKSMKIYTSAIHIQAKVHKVFATIYPKIQFFSYLTSLMCIKSVHNPLVGS